MHENQFLKGLRMLWLAVPLLYLIYVKPFEDPLQTTLELLLLGVILGITILDSIRSWREADEVQLAVTRSSILAGTALGIMGAISSIVVIRYVPGVADLITSMAEFPPIGLSRAAAGFVLGAITTVILVFIGGLTAYALSAWRMAR